MRQKALQYIFLQLLTKKRSKIVQNKLNFYKLGRLSFYRKKEIAVKKQGCYIWSRNKSLDAYKTFEVPMEEIQCGAKEGIKENIDNVEGKFANIEARSLKVVVELDKVEVFPAIIVKKSAT